MGSYEQIWYQYGSETATGIRNTASEIFSLFDNKNMSLLEEYAEGETLANASEFFEDEYSYKVARRRSNILNDFNLVSRVPKDQIAYKRTDFGDEVYTTMEEFLDGERDDQDIYPVVEYFGKSGRDVGRLFFLLEEGMPTGEIARQLRSPDADTKPSKYLRNLNRRVQRMHDLGLVDIDYQRVLRSDRSGEVLFAEPPSDLNPSFSWGVEKTEFGNTVEKTLENIESSVIRRFLDQDI